MTLAIGVVFSKDRALQLDATLGSFFRHVTDPENIILHVIFVTTSESHRQQYEMLEKTYRQVRFIKEQNFRSQLVELVQGNPYTLFLVDDNIFVRPFSLAAACQTLAEDDSALGISLRLGTNTTYCYSLNRPQRIPAFTRNALGLLRYDWRTEECDFNYPLEVSSSIYRTDLIQMLLGEMAFTNPNTLEARLYDLLPAVREPFPILYFYEESITFCNPINMVQTEYTSNRAGIEIQYTSAALSELFTSGRRLDVGRYDGYTPRAVHEEVELHLTAPAPAGGK